LDGLAGRGLQTWPKFSAQFVCTTLFKPKKLPYLTDMVWTFICLWIAVEMGFPKLLSLAQQLIKLAYSLTRKKSISISGLFIATAG